MVGLRNNVKSIADCAECIDGSQAFKCRSECWVWLCSPCFAKYEGRARDKSLYSTMIETIRGLVRANLCLALEDHCMRFAGLFFEGYPKFTLSVDAEMNILDVVTMARSVPVGGEEGRDLTSNCV